MLYIAYIHKVFLRCVPSLLRRRISLNACQSQRDPCLSLFRWHGLQFKGLRLQRGGPWVLIPRGVISAVDVAIVSCDGVPWSDDVARASRCETVISPQVNIMHCALPSLPCPIATLVPLPGLRAGAHGAPQHPVDDLKTKRTGGVYVGILI